MYDCVPDELWSGVFDYIDLSGLLCAMLIDRRSRQLALAHRTYWRDITVDASAEDPLLKSVSLFKTRITRSAARPIRLCISLKDPTDVVDDVRDHLFHTESLDIESSPLHAAHIVEVLASPAPILAGLKLSMRFVWPGGAMAVPDLVFLPHTLFEGHAPALRRLTLYDIGVPNPLPPVFEHLETLNTGFLWPGFTPAIPSPSTRCPNLRALELGGPFTLKDGAFWEPESWRGIDWLLFESEGAATTWHEHRLPISQVRHVGVRGPTAASAAALFSHLVSSSGRDPLVRLTFVYILDSHFRAALDDVHTARCRTVWARTPSPVDLDPEDDVLLELSRISHFIVDFSIPLSLGWELVMTYFTSTCMLRLVSIHLRLDESSSWVISSPEPKLAGRLSIIFPELRTVKLSASQGSETPPVTLDLVTIAEFVAARFRGAPLPVSLSLVHIATRGAWDDVKSTIIPAS